jgi:hypothetical protein
MAKANKALISFTAGEWSPSKDSRADLEKAPAAMRICRNMIVDRYGGVFRRPGLKFVSTIKDFAALGYESFSGSGTLYGITEMGNLTNPPAKFLNLTPNLTQIVRWTPGGANESHKVRARGREYITTAGANPETIGYSYNYANNGADMALDGGAPVGAPEWMGDGNTGGSSGTADNNTFEDYDPNTISGWNGIWHGTWTRGKQSKGYPISSINLASGEDANSPGWTWDSGNIGSTTDPLGRTNVQIYAVEGTDVWTVYCRYGMAQPAVGSGPGTSLYLSVADGDQRVDASGNDVYLIGGAATAGSGTVFFWSKFVLPKNVSFRLNLNITGEVGQQIPPNFQASPYAGGPTEDELEAAGWKSYFYLPDGTAGNEGDNEYREFLSTPNYPWQELELAGSGVVVGTEEWARTTSYTGGITAESRTAISYNMQTVKTSVALTGMTIGYTYPITVDYQERDIGGGNANTGQEIVNHVATAAGETFYYRAIAQIGRERRVTNMTQGTGVAPPAITTKEGQTVLWTAKVLDATGSSPSSAQITLIDDLAAELNANVTKNEIRYLLPFIGGTIDAAMVPLYDIFSWGNSDKSGGSSAFVDGDVSDAGGLVGGANKQIKVPWKPGQFSGWPNFGVGAHIHDANSGGGIDGLMSTYWNNGNNHIYGIRASESANEYRLHCGAVAGSNVTAVSVSAIASDFHLYGQRNSQTDRDVFVDGVNSATTTYSDANGANSGDSLFPIMGDTLSGGVRSWTGTMGVWYWTQGGMSDADQAAIDTALQNFKTATGR